MTRFFFFFLMIFFSFIAVVQAGQQISDQTLIQKELKLNKILNQFYERTQSMQADFDQLISDSYGKTIELSHGKLIFSRPDKFIFEYNSPSEQKYISNGHTLWIYDVELEQVNIKLLDEDLGDSPALLLSSNENVYKHYDVQNLKGTELLQWVQLTAKKEESSFEKVLLAFDQHELKKMKMFDNFGQITELTFTNLELNKPFSNLKFNFIPPEGVDVIGSADAQ